MSDPAKQSAERQTASESRVAPTREPAALSQGAVDAVAVRALVEAADDPLPLLRRLSPPQQQQTLLTLQRTVGNVAVQQVLRTTAIAVIQRVTLSDDDYGALAEQLHDAMSGWGTDEEAIYVSLQKLQKDASAIAKLKTVYKDKFKEDLETEIRSEMSGEELRLALDLIGIKAEPAKGEMVGAAPSAEDEYKTAAKKLNAAMKGLGTDEEAIFAVLVPFNRDAAKLTKLKDVYKTEFAGSVLEDDLKSEMSGSELAYALYLLNAPPPATPAATTTVTAAGTEQHKAGVGGGEVSVRTGAEIKVGGTTLTDTFSVGYEGGLAADSGWVQFLWSEIVATQPDSSERFVAESALPTSNGDMELTTDPSAPKYKVDSGTAASPFYEAGFVGIRTSTGTTIYDRPSEFSSVIIRQFDAGATKVVERDHFDQFLIRDYKAIYHTSLVVEWVYTTKTAITRSTKFGAGGKVDGMPGAMKRQLVAEHPKFEYIQ